VVTVARTLGSGGDELAEAIADELGFRYVDSEIIDRAAVLAGASREQIAAIEDRRGLVDRIISGIRGSTVPGSRDAGSSRPGPGSGGRASHTYEELIVDVIRETAAMEFVVIVAHGAAIPLATVPGVFRVFVTASTATRVARVAAERGIPEAEVRDTVDESDKARADFFRRFYQLHEELPTHYDVVINTDVLAPDAAARGVIALME
jgi:cytidylate kinase